MDNWWEDGTWWPDSWGLMAWMGLEVLWGVCGQPWSLEASEGREGKTTDSSNFCQGACDKLSNGVLRSRKEQGLQTGFGLGPGIWCSGNSRSGEEARFWCNLRPQDVCVLRHLITGHLSFTSQSFYRGLFLTTWLSSYWSPERKSSFKDCWVCTRGCSCFLLP